MITILLLAANILFFIISFLIIWSKGMENIRVQTDHALGEVESILPILSENESYTKERYAMFLLSRCRQLALEVDKGILSDADKLEEAAVLLDIDGVYVTDASGKMVFGYGEEPAVSLPYDRGEAEYTDADGRVYRSGMSEDGLYDIYSVALKNGRFLTMEVSRESFEEFLSNTFSINQQLRLLGLCCDAEVFAVSQKDGTIVTHEDLGLIGRTVRVFPTADNDISLFVTDNHRVYEGQSFYTDDLMIVSAVSFLDHFLDTLAYALQFTFFIALMMSLFARYIDFTVKKGEISKREFSQNLLVLGLVSMVTVFLLTSFWQMLRTTTGRYGNLKTLVEENGEAQMEYLREEKEIYSWLEKQYLIQCRVAAREAEDHGGTMTDQELEELAGYLGVEFVYILDEEGKALVTNSPFDRYALKKDGNQSAAFLPLLQGVDHLVQEVMPDDVSGEMRQYIGVGTRDGKGKTNGCVLISLNPDYRQDLIDLISYENTLPYGVMGDGNLAFIVDKESLEVLSATDEWLKGESILDYGITEEMLREGKEQKIEYNDVSSIMGSYDIGDHYLVMSMAFAGNGSAFRNAFFASFYLLLFLLFFGAIGHRCYVVKIKQDETEEESESEEKERIAANAGEMTEDERGLFVFSKILKNNEKYQFEERWKMQPKKEEDMSTGELVKKSLRGYAFVYCLLFLAPLLLYLFGLETPFGATLAYVVEGNWEKGFNVFIAAQCILLISVMLLINAAAKRLLYYIARISSSRVETICLLLRSTLKYVFAVIGVFYILAQLGVNPAALLASAGVVSVVIGFGAKDITADILAGFFIIFERSFDVGDFISIGDVFGAVSEIGLRTTKIVWYADTTVINNSEIRKVVNQAGDVMRMTVNIRIRYEEKLEELEALIKEWLPGVTEKVTGLVQAPYYQGVSNFGENGLDLRFALYTVGWQRMRAKREFLREMKLFLENHEVPIAYQQVILREEG